MKLNKAREELTKMYLDSLKEDKLPWRKGWENDYTMHQQNPISGTKYHGVNNALLSIVSVVRGYEDPRWMTFKQIQNKEWSLVDAKGQGVPIEYWSVYDVVNKKTISLPEYQRILNNDPGKEKNYRMMDRVYYVFNAEHIKGIPALNINEFSKKVMGVSPFINNLIKNMNVGYKEFGNVSSYIPENDTVVIPKSSQFNSKYEYEATKLHELCHASGHTSRLNRIINNKFGTDNYAKEELRAEISSSFIAQELNLDSSQIELDNHKAYIQNWIKTLHDDPNELFRAIKDAENISNYILKTGEIEKFKIQEDEITLYHGSPNNFNEFDFSKIGQNNTANGFGFYFALSQELAENYCQNGFIYEVSLSPGKELNYTEVSLAKDELEKILANLSLEQQEDLFYNWDENLAVGKEKCINALLGQSGNDVEIIDNLVNQTNNVELILDAFSKKGYTHYFKEYESADKEYVVISKDALHIKNVIDQNEPSQLVMDQNEYLAKLGLESPVSDFLVDKMKGNRQLKTKKGLDIFNKEADAAADEYHHRRNEVIKEYKHLVDEGKIRPKTSIEKSIETAHGHVDHEATHAARRMLAKRGINWKTGKAINESVLIEDANVEQDLTELATEIEMESFINIKVTL